jgi:hypothetical protein
MEGPWVYRKQGRSPAGLGYAEGREGVVVTGLPAPNMAVLLIIAGRRVQERVEAELSSVGITQRHLAALGHGLRSVPAATRRFLLTRPTGRFAR